MPIYKIEASQSLHLGKIDISNTQSIHIGFEKLDTINSINPNRLSKLSATQDIHFSTTITTTQDIHAGNYRRVALQSIADTDWSTAFERGVEPIIIIRSKH